MIRITEHAQDFICTWYQPLRMHGDADVHGADADCILRAHGLPA